MTARSVQLFLSLFFLFCAASTSAILQRPKFEIELTSRVKQHRHKTGDLVVDEEDLRKLIISWKSIAGAQKYELCHNCKDLVDEATGEELKPLEDDVGNILKDTSTCGGSHCVVIPACPLGPNHFHLRYFKHGEWSLWSNVRNFKIGDIGPMSHEEL